MSHSLDAQDLCFEALADLGRARDEQAQLGDALAQLRRLAREIGLVELVEIALAHFAALQSRLGDAAGYVRDLSARVDRSRSALFKRRPGRPVLAVRRAAPRQLMLPLPYGPKA